MIKASDMKSIRSYRRINNAMLALRKCCQLAGIVIKRVAIIQTLIPFRTHRTDTCFKKKVVISLDSHQSDQNVLFK
jgi:hypothetical protein